MSPRRPTRDGGRDDAPPFPALGAALLAVAAVALLAGAAGTAAADVADAHRNVTAADDRAEAGETVRVTVSVVVDERTDRMSITETFSPAFERVEIRSVEVGGESTVPLLAAAKNDTLVVALRDVGAGERVTVTYLLEVPPDARRGDRFRLRGNVSVSNGPGAAIGGDRFLTVGGGHPTPSPSPTGTPSPTRTPTETAAPPSAVVDGGVGTDTTAVAGDGGLSGPASLVGIGGALVAVLVGALWYRRRSRGGRDLPTGSAGAPPSPSASAPPGASDDAGSPDESDDTGPDPGADPASAADREGAASDPEGAVSDTIERLKDLEELRASGAITDEEFERLKSELIDEE